jgi:hypothetical protein
MTKGVVLFAYNNSQIDYVRLAIFSANRIKEHLNVPVTLVTNESSLDSSYSLEVFDNVIHFDEATSNKKYFNDGLDKAEHLEWNNAARFSAYSLSPYDQTIVLDVDYVVNSNNLSKCWDHSSDFLIYKDSADLSFWRDTSEFETISDYSIQFYWATAFFFKKTAMTQHFFRLVEEVKENWNYYKVLYQLHSTSFRNDFAFSIAIHMMNGFTSGEFAKNLPGKMYYTLDTDILTSIENSKMTFLTHRYQSADSYAPLAADGLDIHVMNKYSLLRCINNE